MDDYRTALLEKVADVTNKALRHLAIDHNNLSFHDTFISLLGVANAPGFKALRRGINKIKMKASDIDAELGYQMGGGKNKGMGNILFRDKSENNLVPVDFTSGTKRYIKYEDTTPIQHYEHFEYPSVTKPVKELGNLIVPTLAFTKGLDILEHRGGKSNG